MGRWAVGVVLVVLAGALAGDRLRLFRYQGPDSDDFDKRTFAIASVVDGDTVRIRPVGGGEETRVRLIGIDAPELHPQGRAADYWAVESTEYLKRRLAGGTVIVRLEPLEQRDRYGRLLAYLYVNETEMVNLEMVREGQAYADRRFKHSHKREFERYEAEARKKRRGLWEGVLPEQMPEWRRRWEAEGWD